MSKRLARWLDSAGFTLTELMITVTIIGIVLAAAAPNMNQMNQDRKLRSAATTIESNLRRARSMAVTRNISVRVSVDRDAGIITREADTDGDGDFDTQTETTTLPEGISIENVSFGGGSTVTFDGRGRPDNAGTVAILAPHGFRRTLALAAGSGAVTISHQEAVSEASLSLP